MTRPSRSARHVRVRADNFASNNGRESENEPSVCALNWSAARPSPLFSPSDDYGFTPTTRRALRSPPSACCVWPGRLARGVWRARDSRRRGHLARRSDVSRARRRVWGLSHSTYGCFSCSNSRPARHRAPRTARAETRLAYAYTRACAAQYTANARKPERARDRAQTPDDTADLASHTQRVRPGFDALPTHHCTLATDAHATAPAAC